MRVLGLEIRRAKTIEKAAPPTGLSAVANRGWYRILESFSGAWQRNIESTTENMLTYAAVYACVTLIAQDISKLRIKLVKETSPGIWDETTNPAYSPVLRKPNHFQTRIQFLEQWVISKLTHGNTYILKERDNRRVVTAHYALDPTRVRPLVAPNGDVYYSLQSDPLSGLQKDIVAPASEIIHDVMVPLYHPLCGVTPLTACGVAALQGLSIQNNSTQLFARGLEPPGILTAQTPGIISDEEVNRIQENWQAHFGGTKAGLVAVLGSDMKYQPLSMTAIDAQLIEQLKWTAAEVCTAFKVPGHKVGVGTPPSFNNVEALDQQYYSQCLQSLIENIEVLLDEGLSLGEDLGTELDLDGLLRMDTTGRVDAAAKSMNGGGMTANEARQRYHGLGPVAGGDAVLSQQQNYSLEALAKRDASADPFGSSKTSPAAPMPAPVMPADKPVKALSAPEKKHVQDYLRKRLDLAA